MVEAVEVADSVVGFEVVGGEHLLEGFVSALEEVMGFRNAVWGSKEIPHVGSQGIDHLINIGLDIDGAAQRGVICFARGPLL